MFKRLTDYLFGREPVAAEPPPSAPPRPALTAVPAPLYFHPEPELLTQNWSHPFGDRSDHFQQLTHLAKASNGFYPIGVHGTWHAGVHFDAGTAGALDQSRVLCLADGEVVAYRIPSTTLTTRFSPFPKPDIEVPFASGFVLVRHRIQAPAINGNKETPPELTFYSLYMHLEDWAAYDSSSLQRPGFWAESEEKWVKDNADYPYKGREGLKVTGSRESNVTLDVVLPGTKVTVSGTGRYRRLENTLGPASLRNADGTLRGYVAARYLHMRAGDAFSVKADSLNVRAEPNEQAAVLAKLPKDTIVRFSGDGDFVKLDYVEQYVLADGLRSEQVPACRDEVFVPEQPIPIKAGDLIGHIGPYQNGRDSQPRRQLHLEVFTVDYFPNFLRDSRAWAAKLPKEEKTWLKLAKGTPVVFHKDSFGPKAHPISETHTPDHISDTDFLIPKSLLDNLPAGHRIERADPPCIWYRLEGLFHDAKGELIDGWVKCVSAQDTWVSPWDWDGYEIIQTSRSPVLGMAYRMYRDKATSEADRERVRPQAEAWNQGELMSHLYQLIDRNHDRHMSADEVRTALQSPVLAQALSRIVLNSESEWCWRQEKWDALDAVFGHTTSAPLLNWIAEKGRIKALSWWNEVMGTLRFPEGSGVYFLHPLGLVGLHNAKKDMIDTERFILIYEEHHKLFASGTKDLSTVSKNNLRELITAINDYYESDLESANIYAIAYMLATTRHETYHFLSGEYFSKKPEIGSRDYFDKYDPVLAKTEAHRKRAIRNGNTAQGDGYKYRGRGPVHLTWKMHYQTFSEIIGYDFVTDPDAAGDFKHSVPIMIIGMTRGLFTTKKLETFFGNNKKDYLGARKMINGTDQDSLIASYAERFEKILREASTLRRDQ